MIRSMIPCDEVLENGSKCGRTPTERVEVTVLEGRNGPSQKVFHFCVKHRVDRLMVNPPRIVEDWLVAQRR